MSVLALTLRLLPLAVPAPSSPAEPMREVRLVMGTTAEVAAWGLAAPRDLEAAFGALDEVDRLMSLWRESELRRLNQRGRGRLSAATLKVLHHALDVAAASEGGFDPTIQPLIEARGGYGGAPREPRADETRRLLALVGFRAVEVRGDAVTLPRGGGLDLGGLAKGYAADEALAALQRAGARSALVDLGGSTLRAFGRPVPLAVRNPEDSEGEPWAAFLLDEGGVGTSAADQRGAHILDPRTGEPARSVLSATVVAGTGVEADALSTAVFVLGREAGLALAERRGAAALVLTRESGRPVVETTRGFARRFRLTVAPGALLRERP